MKDMLKPWKCISAGCEKRTCGKEILSLYLKAMLSNYRPGDILERANRVVRQDNKCCDAGE